MSNKKEVREFYRLGGKVHTKCTRKGYNSIPTVGVIVAGTYDSDTSILKIHFSRCAHMDPFNKQLGKQIAMGRARSSNPVMSLPITDEAKVGAIFRSTAEDFISERLFVGVETKGK